MQGKIIESDVVVIGAGIAGAMAAYQLAAKGKRVAVVEKGIRLTPELIQDIFDSESFVGNPDVPQHRIEFAGETKRARAIPSVVGGMARFYAAVSLRMREKEFERWPFSYASLEPYYTKAEQLMQISGNGKGDPCDPSRSLPHPLTLPMMNEHSLRLFEAAKRLGLNPFQHPIAINFDAGCVRCNHCNQVPCAYLAKWDPDHFLMACGAVEKGPSASLSSSALLAAYHSGTPQSASSDCLASGTFLNSSSNHKNLPIDLFYETKASQIVWKKEGADRKIESIEAVNKKGEAFQFRAKQFVFASGAIFTPVLLLQSGVQDWNPLVGTHLMTHCLGLVIGFFPFAMSAEQAFNKWFSIADYYFDERGGVRGLIQQDHLTTRKKVLAKIPGWLQPLVAKFYYNTCQMLVIGEDEPRRENHIDVSAVIHHAFTPADEAKRNYLGREAKRVMRKAGALLALLMKGKSIYHACGTCRMGESMADSVTTKNGLIWGTTNAYIADASTFPTSSGVNPSLTIAANALRIADGI